VRSLARVCAHRRYFIMCCYPLLPSIEHLVPGTRGDILRLEQRAQDGLRRREPGVAQVAPGQQARRGDPALPARGMLVEVEKKGALGETL